MKKFLLGLLLAALVAGVAPADLTVVCSDKVKAGQMARLWVKVDDAKDAASAAIDVDFDRDPLDLEKLGDKSVFTGQGVYVIKVTAFYLDKDGKPKIQKVKKTVEFEGVLPPPLPPVPPGPTPPAPPAPGQKMAVTLVYDAGSVDLSMAAAQRSKDLITSLMGAGHKVRWYDKSSPVLEKANLKAKAEAAGYPCVIVQTADGKLWPEGKAVPFKTEADILAAVKRAGG